MAMPIDAALPVIRQIVKTGQATRNYLGMTVVALSSTVVDSVNKQNPKLRVKENSGLFITSVRPDGPAAKAGIQTCAWVECPQARCDCAVANLSPHQLTAWPWHVVVRVLQLTYLSPWTANPPSRSPGCSTS